MSFINKKPVKKGQKVKLKIPNGRKTSNGFKLANFTDNTIFTIVDFQTWLDGNKRFIKLRAEKMFKRKTYNSQSWDYYQADREYTIWIWSDVLQFTDSVDLEEDYEIF